MPINQHINNYLESYISLNSPKFAVKLIGSWGCGKTTFIHNFISKHTETKFYYISLHGISNKQEIDAEIFALAHPILNSKRVRLAGRIAKGVLKGAFKIDLEDGSSVTSKPEISISENDLETRTEDIIFIFDDIERCIMQPALVMSYINHLVEFDNAKAILIADEEKIESTVTTNPNLSYQSIKEKLVGKTLKILTDLPTFVESRFAINPVENLNIEESSAAIIKLCEEIKFSNLRVVGHSISDFCSLIQQTNTEKQLSEATINTFRDVFFPLSIHYRVNNNPILFEALSNPYPNMSSTDKKDIKTERELFLDTFKEQFGGDILWLATNILSEEQWKKLLIGEICNITEHLKNAAPSDSKDESWKEILQIYQLTDEQFAEVLAREIRKIENGLYKKVGILKHFIHIFQFIENKKILQSTSEYVQKVIATIDNIDYLELKNSEEYDSSHGGYGGYTYITSDNCGLEKRSYIADFMKHINTRKLHLEQQILRDNSENFPFNSIVYTTELLGPEAKRQLDNKIDYHRLPILKYIKPLDFQNMLSTSNSRDISSLLKVCKDRATFSKIHRLSIMKEKLNFWNELLLLVRKHLETNLTALRLGFVFAEQSITSLINTLEEIDTDYPN